MDASIVSAASGFQRSTLVGPSLHSSPIASEWPPPVPLPKPSLDGSNGPTTALSRCIGDVEEFTSVHWGRRPLLITGEARSGDCGVDDFHDVLTLDAVDELVARAARPPAIRMVADGTVLAPSRFCSRTRVGGQDLDDVVDPVKVAARLADGATLIVQSIHRTSTAVGGFVTQLQEEVSHPVQANAYLTPSGATGLAEHGDHHDVLAIQLHGSRCLWVDGIGDVTMHPGDVLYVPRGVRRHAERSGETSLHLTIGIIVITYRQVIERLLGGGPETIDGPLPIGYRHRSCSDRLEHGIESAVDAVLDLFGSVDPADVTEREQLRRMARPLRAGRVSSIVRLGALDADTVVQWVAPEPLAHAVDEADGRGCHWDGLRDDGPWGPSPERVAIHLGDRVLTAPAAALGALRTLSDGRPVRVGDLPGLDEPSRVALAERLVREAACTIVALPPS